MPHRITQHTRLQRTMRSPDRAARRAKKQRRQSKFVVGTGIPERPRAYASTRLPAGWLSQIFGPWQRFVHRDRWDTPLVNPEVRTPWADPDYPVVEDLRAVPEQAHKQALRDSGMSEAG